MKTFWSLIKNILRACVVPMPWRLKRRVLGYFFGYQLDPSARIGLSWFFPGHLEMGSGARIGHFNVALHLHWVVMGPHAVMVRGNWVTGFPQGDSRHFSHMPERDPSLYVGEHTHITKSHHFDCTECIRIGAFTTIAGYGSQFITHAIHVERNRQEARPLVIGSYCLVGTHCVCLGGSSLPDRSVLGAQSLLNKAHETPLRIYGGVPAREIREISSDAAYFHRTEGFVE